MLKAALQEWGLNLVHSFKLNELPEPIYFSLSSHVSDAGGDINRYQRLVLIAHGGRKLWQRFNQEAGVGENPLDQMCVDAWQSVMSGEDFRRVEYEILYPTSEPLASCGVSLAELGSLAGWQQKSPLGIGIHPEFGLWSAIRLLVLVDGDSVWPDDNDGSEAQKSPSICDSCVDRPCLSSCPAGATDFQEFDVPACIAFRQTDASPCEQTCLSRLACPVAKEHSYSKVQLNYHYAYSLQMVKILGESSGSKK